MLSFDEKILLLYDLLSTESKVWVVTKLRELTQLDHIYNDNATCKILLGMENCDDTYLPAVIYLLKPKAKVWLAGKLWELAQIRTASDINDVYEFELNATLLEDTQLDS